MLEMNQRARGTPISLKKPRQGRSPAFPFIPLQKALERAETFRVAEGGRPTHFAPFASAAKAWGIGTRTGLANQTVAALGHYGLFEFEGSGEKRSVRLTDRALRILLDKQPVSLDRDELLHQVALTPPIHAELWQKWQDKIPSDATLETYLVRDRGFSENGARDLIDEYKQTIKFSKLYQPAIIPVGLPINEACLLGEGPRVGDMIQIVSGGMFRLEEPSRVRAIRDHNGQRWVFIDGSKTGIPSEQTVVESRGNQEGSDAAVTSVSFSADGTPPYVGIRKEIFALEEGDVALTFPDTLSATSFEDLEAYFAIFLRRARRRAGLEESHRENT